RPGKYHPEHGAKGLPRHPHAAGAPQCDQGADADGHRRHDGRSHQARRGAVLGRQDRVQAPRVLLLPQLPLRLRLEGQPAPARRAHSYLGPSAQVRPRLQGDLRRRRHDEPLRDPAAGRLDRVLQRGAGRGVDQARHRRVRQVRLAESRARGDLVLPAVDRDREGADERAHVSHHARGPRARDAGTGEVVKILENLLRRRFGLRGLRPGQREVIESVLAGRDTLAIMPSGAGKSLCYQLPTLHRRGTTIVVSPLIATATPDVIEDIARQLERPRMRVLNAGVYRPNLYFEVLQTTNEAEKKQALLEVVRSGGAGIVYCATVRAAKAVHGWLAGQGE